MNLHLPVLVSKVLNSIELNKFQAYVVGGSVRDVLSNNGQGVKDWDFTTDAEPEQIIKLFPESFYDNKFGTVGVTVEELVKQFGLEDYDLEKDHLRPEDVFEITTFRSEGSYSDFRRPDFVTWGETIEEDLKRRDFTMNAMALRLIKEDKYELIDLFGGKQDLENKLIKAVGDPSERFGEDALRMMRAVRMAAQLGFSIEPQTLDAINRNAHLITKIAWERIGDEILKLVSTQYAVDGMKLLLSTGLLHYVLPEMELTVGVVQAGHHTKDVWHHSIDAMGATPTKDPIVRLATLIHDSGKPIAFRQEQGKITFYGHEVISGKIAKRIGQRLHLSNRDQERLYILTRYHMFAYDTDMTDAAIRRFIRKVGLDNIKDMMRLRMGDRVGGGSPETSWRLKELNDRIEEVLYTPMQIKDLKVSGNDIMEILGIGPGPKIGEILQKLFDEVMEDSSKNEREYLLNRIKELE
jgi:tRNA nucleotidyltransferase (CCA-adding enzyme)